MKLHISASKRARQTGLDSCSPSQRAEAEQTIRAMGPDAIPFLLQVIEEQSRRAGYRLRLYVALFLVIGACYFVIGLAFLPEVYSAVAGWSLIAFFSSLLILVLRQWQRGASRLHERAGALFARMATTEQIGPLIELLESSEGEMFQTACEGLTRLFPTLRATDSTSLTTGHRKILVRQLFRFRGATEPTRTFFTVSLLGALQQVGDASFIEPVQEMVQDGPIDRSVRKAALECLPYLEAFALQEQRSGTLVRVAPIPEDATPRAILGRPAASPPTAEPALLLRPLEDAE